MNAKFFFAPIRIQKTIGAALAELFLFGVAHQVYLKGWVDDLLVKGHDSHVVHGAEVGHV